MKELSRRRVQLGETAATIVADKARCIESALDAIREARRQVQREVSANEFFLTSLEPVECSPAAGPVPTRMCGAAKLAGVGPMAAVAGAIAHEAVEAMARDGCRHGWVDNGGDVVLMLDEPVTLEVFSDPGTTETIALELEPTGRIIGVCSSSGRLGNSISLGDSDVALAMADSGYLADALATAIGNLVKDRESLRTCFGPFEDVHGFVAGLAMIDGVTAMHGDLPRVVRAEHNAGRLTAHTCMSFPRYTGRPGLEPEVRT
jgi:ApbE superfamily uncharacterized protein (UPF0280 family)